MLQRSCLGRAGALMTIAFAATSAPAQTQFGGTFVHPISASGATVVFGVGTSTIYWGTPAKRSTQSGLTFVSNHFGANDVDPFSRFRVDNDATGFALAPLVFHVGSLDLAGSGTPLYPSVNFLYSSIRSDPCSRIGDGNAAYFWLSNPRRVVERPKHTKSLGGLG